MSFPSVVILGDGLAGIGAAYVLGHVEWKDVTFVEAGSMYRNRPLRSETWRNVFFAGNYRTFPSLASTGTALMSGVEAAEAVLRGHGSAFAISDSIRGFRH